MAYGDFKDLARRLQSNKVLQTKFLQLQVIQNMMDFKEN